MRIRFGLRSLMIATVIVAAIPTYCQHLNRVGRREDQLIRALIDEQKISVFDLAEVPDTAATRWLKWFGGHHTFRRVASVTLEPQFTASDYARLVPLAELDTLITRNATIDDESLQALSQLPSIESLQLGRSRDITKSGVAALTKLSNLRTLYAGQLPVSDQDLALLLKSMPRLEKLHLGGMEITDAVVDSLIEHGSLRQLSLYPTSISSAGMIRLLR
ncbi:MAG: hypothetical protein KDB23_21045, partial [Planctomycetales bacterium]|nr:hypothetical protein [Planctomycetales bacterium]